MTSMGSVVVFLSTRRQGLGQVLVLRPFLDQITFIKWYIYSYVFILLKGYLFLLITPAQLGMIFHDVQENILKKLTWKGKILHPLRCLKPETKSSIGGKIVKMGMGKKLFFKKIFINESLITSTDLFHR